MTIKKVSFSDFNKKKYKSLDDNRKKEKIVKVNFDKNELNMLKSKNVDGYMERYK